MSWTIGTLRLCGKVAAMRFRWVASRRRSAAHRLARAAAPPRRLRPPVRAGRSLGVQAIP